MDKVDTKCHYVTFSAQLAFNKGSLESSNEVAQGKNLVFELSWRLTSIDTILPNRDWGGLSHCITDDSDKGPSLAPLSHSEVELVHGIFPKAPE